MKIIFNNKGNTDEFIHGELTDKIVIGETKTNLGVPGIVFNVPSSGTRGEETKTNINIVTITPFDDRRGSRAPRPGTGPGPDLGGRPAARATARDRRGKVRCHRAKRNCQLSRSQENKAAGTMSHAPGPETWARARGPRSNKDVRILKWQRKKFLRSLHRRDQLVPRIPKGTGPESAVKLMDHPIRTLHMYPTYI